MTTNVIVNAHFGANTEKVEMSITDNGELVEEIVLQDGESADRVVHDNRQICVKEIIKK